MSQRATVRVPVVIDYPLECESMLSDGVSGTLGFGSESVGTSGVTTAHRSGGHEWLKGWAMAPFCGPPRRLNGANTASRKG